MKDTIRFGSLSLPVRLQLTILPLLLIVMVLFGQQCNLLYADMITNELSVQINLQLDSVASRLSAQLSEINRMAFYVYGHQEMRKELARAAKNPDSFTAADRISLQNDLIKPMMSMIDSPGNYFYTLYPVSDLVFCDYDYVWPLSEFPETLPLEEMINTGYARVFYGMAPFMNNVTSMEDYLCVTQVIYHSDRTPIGVLLTRVRAERLEEAIRAILPQDGQYYYRCTLNEGITVFEGGEMTEDMIFMTASTFNGRARLEYGMHPLQITRQIHQQNRALIRFSVVAISAALVLIAFSSRLVLRRMRMVLQKFSRIEPGQELAEEPLSGLDEAALLDQTFTRLYRDYRTSVFTQEKMKESQRRLENNLLLSRINPHFLYNTLSAIRWNLPRENWNTIDELVTFYRGMLSKGKEITMLHSELELMEQYLSLQRFTYSRKVNYRQSLETDVGHLFIPKFILQPVFENALKYGGGEETLSLNLNACVQENCLIITLKNDGEPIDTQTMERLNQLNTLPENPLYSMTFDKRDDFGYGVFNIIMRLRLLFGLGYGLWHLRPDEGGTCARYVLPVCEQPDSVMNWKKTI